MFTAAGPIPSNIVFNENFDKLVGTTQPTEGSEDNYEMSLEEELRIKENELKSLIEDSELSQESRIELIVVNNLKKITPESAQKETGGKSGINKDIDISFLNKNGSTVEAAAEDIWMDLDTSYQNMYDVQDIRNIIIDILMIGKKKFIENYTPSLYLIEKLKSEISELKQKIKEKNISNKPTVQEEDMKVFQSALNDNDGVLPNKFIVSLPTGTRTWIRNSRNLYDLVDNNTILLRNVNMETGLVEKQSTTPVDESKRKALIDQFTNLRATMPIDEILAEKGIDANDVLLNLQKAKTQEDLLKIETEILKKLC